MDKARSWFIKFKSKDKSKPSNKKETTGNGKEAMKVPTSEEAPSNVTKQRAAAAKQTIENFYKKQNKSLQERKERYGFNASFYNNELIMFESLSLNFRLVRKKKNLFVLQFCWIEDVYLL
jgi:hypothetical protein